MKNKFTYMLRKTLPLWKWKETIDEVIDYCKQYNINEVMWKVDAEDFSHGLPSIQFIKQYIRPLAYARDLSRANGIEFSINPWVTVGHDDRGHDLSSVHPGIHCLVDATGIEATECACPLSKVWRTWLNEAYNIYASLSPNILWVEDDLRVFLHPPIQFGCFCEEHLEKFSHLINKKITREELVNCILKGNEPHPYRQIWLDMNGEMMIEVARELEKSVHSVNKDIKLGLMCSNPINHAIEGRKWHELMQALCGDNLPVARPSLGSYNEYLPVDLIECMDIGRATVACLPDHTKICPEIENVTFTLFSKSIKYTRLQLGLCSLLGFENVTLNLYDHVGSSIKEQPEYIYMLDEARPFIESILEVNGEEEKGEELGVSILHNTKGPYYTELKEKACYGDLDPKTMGFSIPLQSLGIPVTFKDSKVRAITGQFFKGKTHEQIIKILSEGLLLDISAANDLQEMGYGEYLGIEIKELFNRKEKILSAESYTCEKFGGRDNRYLTMLTLTPDEIYGEVKAFEETYIISNLVNNDREEVIPFVTAYENELGGRVVVYSLDMSKGMSRGLKSCFLSWGRMEQLGEIIKWISKNEKGYQSIDAAYQYTVCRRYNDFDYLGVANLMTDKIEKIKIKVSNIKSNETIKKLKVATKSGYTDIKFSFENDVLIIDKALPHKEFTAIKIYYTLTN